MDSFFVTPTVTSANGTNAPVVDDLSVQETERQQLNVDLWLTYVNQQTAVVDQLDILLDQYGSGLTDEEALTELAVRCDEFMVNTTRTVFPVVDMTVLPSDVIDRSIELNDRLVSGVERLHVVLAQVGERLRTVNSQKLNKPQSPTMLDVMG